MQQFVAMKTRRHDYLALEGRKHRSYPQTSPYRSYTPSTDCARSCRKVENFGILFPFPYLLSSGDVSLAVARRVGLDSEVPFVTHRPGFTVASREIETTVFDPASQFLSNISRRV